MAGRQLRQAGMSKLPQDFPRGKIKEKRFFNQEK